MKIDIEYLRQKTDIERKYVDFQTIRNCLSVLAVAEDVGANLTEPNSEGECRGDCPKCDKRRSFSLNINTNRFNCFNTKCDLKGSGIIDFASKLFDCEAKETCHLLACAYGIQPYVAEFSGAGLSQLGKLEKTENLAANGSFVLRSDFEALEAKHNELRMEFNRLRNIVYEFMLERDDESIQNYENGEHDHLVMH